MSTLISKRSIRVLAAAAVLAFSAAGCGNKTQPQSATPEPSPTSIVQAAGMPTPTPTPAVTPEPTAQPELESLVSQTAAYYFPEMNALYAAVEFTNTGNLNATVESVSVEISYGPTTITQTFTPTVADMDIVEPGETTTVSGWFTCSKAAPTAQEQITASATVSLRATSQTQQKPLELEHLMIVQNYPGFATVSGCITNPSEDEDCNLTTVYLSFYDGEGKLLGVQYFSKNLKIPAGEKRDFVYHLRSLPIPNLTENTATIIARGMGIN